MLLHLVFDSHPQCQVTPQAGKHTIHSLCGSFGLKDGVKRPEEPPTCILVYILYIFTNLVQMSATEWNVCKQPPVVWRPGASASRGPKVFKSI